MKYVVATILVVLALALLGWLSFSNSANESAIHIDKQEIKEDTGKAVEKSKELIHDLKDEVKDAHDDRID